MDPEVYGRSVLENSSFIATSNNPDPKIMVEDLFQDYQEQPLNY